MFQTANSGYFLKRKGIQLHLYMQKTAEFKGSLFYAYYMWLHHLSLMSL